MSSFSFEEQLQKHRQLPLSGRQQLLAVDEARKRLEELTNDRRALYLSVAIAPAFVVLWSIVFAVTGYYAPSLCLPGSAIIMLVVASVILTALAWSKQRESSGHLVVVTGRLFSPESISRDPRYRATVAEIGVLEGCAKLRNFLSRRPQPERGYEYSILGMYEDDVWEELATLAGSFQEHPLCQPMGGHPDSWNSFERQCKFRQGELERLRRP